MKCSVLKPVLAKIQELISSLIEYIKENTLNFVLSSLGIILTVTIILILNYHFSIRWWHILIVGVVAYAFFISYIIKHNTISIKCTELERANSSLQNTNSILYNEISILQTRIRGLEKQLNEKEVAPTLETNFLKILHFFQALNISIDDLPDSDANFINTIHMEQNMALSAYGYKFVDYEGNESLYEVEYQTIDSPELIVRAIIDKDNNIAVKGRIYLPLNYGRR